MKNAVKLGRWLLICALVSSAAADTFKHKGTGETFAGFATQKTAGGKTLIFNSEQNKMIPVVLSDYEITYNSQGRRDSVVLIPLTQPEILLSQTLSEKVASAIVDASNTGPQAIILQIDSPGGRGDYMALIASALSQTVNCPTAAFISGGTHGGAFSAAAVLAAACQRVYIAPNAAIGAVGPAAGIAGSTLNFGDFLATYCPDTLATFSTYVSTLAQQRGRPDLLMRALVDKRLSVVEVMNINGSRQFIQKNDRQPSQTLVRTLAEGLSGSSSDTSKLTPSDLAGTVLTMTPQDAVAAGLADKIVSSISEVLADMNISDAKVTSAGGLDTLIRQFKAARRNIAQGLASIERLEEQTTKLDEQFFEMDKQLRSGLMTREVTQGGSGVYQRRSRDRLTVDYNRSFRDTAQDSMSSNQSSAVGRIRTPRTESITTIEPAANIEIVRGQLIASLRNLSAEYRRVINLAKRWPGGLPAQVSIEQIQNNLDSAAAQLDNLYRYQPIYQNQSPQPPAARPIR